GVEPACQRFLQRCGYGRRAATVRWHSTFPPEMDAADGRRTHSCFTHEREYAHAESEARHCAASRAQCSRAHTVYRTRRRWGGEDRFWRLSAGLQAWRREF